MQPIETFLKLPPDVQSRAEELDRREEAEVNRPHPSGLNRKQRRALAKVR